MDNTEESCSVSLPLLHNRMSQATDMPINQPGCPQTVSSWEKEQQHKAKPCCTRTVMQSVSYSPNSRMCFLFLSDVQPSLAGDYSRYNKTPPLLSHTATVCHRSARYLLHQHCDIASCFEAGGEGSLTDS